MKTQSLVIDTDTGSDDAVALLMAARLPGASIRAVTTVAGNVGVSQATRNALATLEIAEIEDVPVYAGAARPLMRSLDTAQHVHGEDGMSGVPLRDPSRSAQRAHAVDALRDIASNEPGEHTLVTLGPLTNIAAALVCEPNLFDSFRSVVAMGGAFDGVGNVHRVGEFNLWADPEAAKMVVDAIGTVTFVGWDMSRRHAVITPDEQDEIRRLGPLGEFAVDINRCVDEFARNHSGLAGYDLPDPLALAVAIDPRVATQTRRVHLDIGLDEAGRGGTFIDHRLVAEPPNATVVTNIDGVRFKRMLAAACGGPARSDTMCQDTACGTSRANAKHD